MLDSRRAKLLFTSVSHLAELAAGLLYVDCPLLTLNRLSRRQASVAGD